MPRRCAVAFPLLLLGSAQPSPVPGDEPSYADFPPQDAQVRIVESRGRLAALAAARLEEDPGSVATVRLLAQSEDIDGVLRALRTIVDGDPARISDAFEAARDVFWRLRGDGQRSRQHAGTLKDIVRDARLRLPQLAREDAARAERVFVTIDAELSDDPQAGWEAHAARFVERYASTEPARLTEVDLIARRRVSPELFEALDGIVRGHPGTVMAAKALYLQGFHWHTISTLGTIEPHDADPTERFMRVRDIVAELESGRYPPSEWVERAPSLITGFFLSPGVAIAPGNVERLLHAFEEFARSRFVLDDDHPMNSGIGYVITGKMADLFDRQGRRVSGVERVLDGLERSVSDPSPVRYLRGLFYLASAERQAAEREALFVRARQTLAALANEGRSLYHRKALATLAALEFARGEYAGARAAFLRYVEAYPQSSWSWLAMLRIGQFEEELGSPRAAAAAYLQAAAAYADLPLARVLGHAYAARAHEAAGEFEEALAGRQRALDAWDDRFGQRYSTFVRRSANAADPFVPAADVAEVAKERLPPRIAQLKKSLGAAGGAMLERGRWLLDRGRLEDAIEELQRLMAQHPGSPVLVEARDLAARARLERALALGDAGRPGADAGAALEALELVAREPNAFVALAASMARASLLWARGEAAIAEQAMRDALGAWHARQQPSTPAPGIEEDVAEIRRVVFLPRGGPIYAGGRWNAFSWPVTPPPPFVLVNTEVRVRQHDGSAMRVRLHQTFPGVDRVLAFDREQIALLQKTIVTLGGTRRREPRHVMETPFQPVGDAMEILQFWNRFFPARPGHWGGWELETYPVVSEIHFLDAGRTRAAARVTVGYSGATVELEKRDGVWTATRLTEQWMT